ncbi:ABC transporter permease subunit [Candidatus Poriferisodalis sp.]|uniref:branched-chain amino acid ABC transporter ATP-binding protein/permease n=1 Tax=Candidatus Poriferisodalis sp. TaxID=3101277 RepID=UPI003B01B276
MSGVARSVPGRFVLALGAAAGASVLLGDYRSGQLSLFLSLALVAVSLDLVWGYAGILSLGQLLPFGTAAYLTARLTSAAPELSAPAIVASAAVGMALAAGIGTAAFKRRLSLVVVGLLTLMLSLAFEQIAEQWRTVTGGFNGLTDVPRMNFAGWELSEQAQDLAVTVLAVAVIGAVGVLLTRPAGAVLIGVRDNERRIEALGYDTVAVKIWAYALGGAVAGVAGALYVHRTGFVSPGVFGFALATNVVLWTLIGGRGTVLGPVIGTLAVNFATAALADAWLQYWVLTTGVIFVACTLLVPEGLLPWVLRLGGRPPRPARAPALTERGPDDGRPAGSTVLAANGLGKSFGPFVVLDSVDLEMDSAELRCLIGPNGAGKTTLLDILCGQQAHAGGTVTVFGEDFTGRPAWSFARGGVARKFQAPQVVGSLSVGENLAVAAWGGTGSLWSLARRPWSADIGPGALRILERTGLGDRRHEPAGTLSHGEQQWLEIAMAMAGRCRLLLLDEPTAGMSAAESLGAAALLRDLHAELGVPVVIVEHDMTFIRAVADRVTVLAGGRVIADGTVEAVESDPRVRAVYLGAGDAGA